MAELIDKTDYYGNHTNTYKVQIPILKEANEPQLKVCYCFCHHPDILITDILLEEINKNTGYNIAWQNCIRYDVEDFHQTFQNFKDFLSEYDTEKFERWCMLFKLNNVNYSISGKAQTDEIKLSCYWDIQDNMIKLLEWVEEKVKEMEIQK